MKIVAFARRLARDLKTQDLATLAAEDRIEIIDAINGALAVMHAHAPPHSKIVTAALTLQAPTTGSVTVAEGETTLGGYAPTEDDVFCTIRIDGDGGDNEITPDGSLLFPYAGASGSRSFTLYHDAASLPEPIEEIIEDPEDIDTLERLTQDAARSSRQLSAVRSRTKQTGDPRRWWIEENAANRAGDPPSVFRVDTLPLRLIRLRCEVSNGPARVSFQSLLHGDAEIPMRAELIEAYLLPIARGNLTSSSLWRKPEMAASIDRKAEAAESRFASLAPKTLATPSNRVFTPMNY
jgi:hypothetical protein